MGKLEQPLRRLDEDGSTTRLLDELEQHFPGVVEAAGLVENGGTGGGEEDPKILGTGRAGGTGSPAEASGNAAIRLAAIFTYGIAEECFQKAANLLDAPNLTTNEKLTQIHRLIP